MLIFLTGLEKARKTVFLTLLCAHKAVCYCFDFRRLQVQVHGDTTLPCYDVRGFFLISYDASRQKIKASFAFLYKTFSNFAL